jgi:plasmid stabilization system protein ParE
MTTIRLAPEILLDFERILAHWRDHEIQDLDQRMAEILAAIDVLQTSPQIGRLVRDDMRELIIGKGSRGYVALYHFMESLDIVLVLALRSQKEAGYQR